MAGTGAGSAIEVAKIVLELETNFKQVLKQQIGAFDKFTKEANTLTRQVGSHMNQLAKATSTTFSTIYKGNRKEVQEMVAFTRSALQGVRKETMKIQALQEKYQKGQMARMLKVRQAMKKARPRVAEIDRSGMSEGAKESLKKTIMAPVQRAKAEYDSYLRYVQLRSETLLPKIMADAIDKAMRKIAEGSRAAAKIVHAVTNDMQAQFNKIWRKRGITPKADTVTQGAGLLKQRAAAIKQMDALLAQHQKKQVLAEQYLQKQVQLLAQQTNKKLAGDQQKMILAARKNVKMLSSEYEFMYNKINKMKSGQISQSGLFKKQAQEAVNAIKQQLRGANLKRDFEKMWGNLSDVARLAGQKTGKAFYDAVDKGNALDASLRKKQDLLEGVLATAKKLQATGLIDASKQIERLNKVIGGIKRFRAEYKQVKKEITSIPKISYGTESKGGAIQARSLAFEIRKASAALKQMGAVSEDNVIDMQRHMQMMKRMYKQHQVYVVRTQNTISKIHEKVAKGRAIAAQSNNKKVIAAWAAYERKALAVVAKLEKTLKRSVLPVEPFHKFEKDTIGMINRVRGQAAKGMLPSAEIRKGVNQISASYDKLSEKMTKLGTKRIINKKNLKEGAQFLTIIQQKMKDYNAQIVKLNTQLERMRRLQKAGGAGTTGMSEQISGMKGQMMQLQQGVRSYEKMHAGMQKRMATAQRQSLKGILSGGWEMIRNFRWQVAAVIYLISRAVNAVKRVFFNVFGEIAKYRREAMTLAAQFSFKMLGNMKDNFDGVYQYARQLMNKMEQVAAGTILTMEDMTMLVRTFSQAGLIPNPREDVDKIAVIGTAIKTLTEGMANAGTQMRQELYAVIAGRQRATDQLAMMFKMMGINIQKTITDARAEGKNLIDTLSKALKPFSVLNEKLANEWEAVLNKMKLAWQVIKRIGLETALLDMTEKFSTFIDQFYDVNTGITEQGRKVAASLRAAFEIFMALVDTLKITLVLIWDVVKNIVLEIGRMGTGITSTTDDMKNLSESMRGMLGITEMVLKFFWLMNHTLKAIHASVLAVWSALKFVWNGLGGITETIIGSLAYLDSLGTRGGDLVAQGVKRVGDAWKDVSEKGQALIDLPQNAQDEYEAIGKSIEELGMILDRVANKAVNLQSALELKYDPTALFDQASKFENKIKQAELAGLPGDKRAKAKYRLVQEDLAYTKKGLASNLAQIEAYNFRVSESGIKLTEDDKIRLAERLDGHKIALARMGTYEEFARKEMAKDLAAYYKTNAEKLAGHTRQHKQLWENIVPKDLTRGEKTTKWFNEMSAKLDELKVKNPLVRAEFEKLSKALDGAVGQRAADDIKNTAIEFDKFKVQLTSHRPIDSVSKIVNEFDKMALKFKKNIDFTEDQEKAFKKLFDITQQERIEVEKLNLAYKAGTAELDLRTKKAEYLAGSYSPSNKMQAELELISINYQKEMEKIQKLIDDTYAVWVDNGKWATTEGSAEAKRYVVALQDQMQELTRVTTRELSKKQIPIWNDLVEASNSWADGFTDALSQIVDGVDSVSTALASLQKQILKDVMKTIIKRTVTDSLQSSLGSAQKGDESPFQKAFGFLGFGKKEEGAQEITAKNPIPVTIYNPDDLTNSLGAMGKDKFKLEGGITGAKVFITNWPGGGLLGGIGAAAEEGVQGVSQDLADISKEISDNTGTAAENSKKWYSDITNTFSGMGSWISGLFGAGGGASGGGGGGGMDWASMALQVGAGLSMAEGGTISEHVVGKGMESGKTYNFGEKAKYGENEMVAPMRKLQRSGSKSETFNMPINISAIDTQSGVQFLMKNSDVIQGQMISNLKKNKPIRKGIQNAY